MSSPESQKETEEVRLPTIEEMRALRATAAAARRRRRQTSSTPSLEEPRRLSADRDEEPLSPGGSTDSDDGSSTSDSPPRRRGPTGFAHFSSGALPRVADDGDGTDVDPRTIDTLRASRGRLKQHHISHDEHDVDEPGFFEDDSDGDDDYESGGGGGGGGQASGDYSYHFESSGAAGADTSPPSSHTRKGRRISSTSWLSDMPPPILELEELEEELPYNPTLYQRYLEFTYQDPFGIIFISILHKKSENSLKALALKALEPSLKNFVYSIFEGSFSSHTIPKFKPHLITTIDLFSPEEGLGKMLEPKAASPKKSPPDGSQYSYTGSVDEYDSDEELRDDHRHSGVFSSLREMVGPATPRADTDHDAVSSRGSVGEPSATGSTGKLPKAKGALRKIRERLNRGGSQSSLSEAGAAASDTPATGHYTPLTLQSHGPTTPSRRPRAGSIASQPPAPTLPLAHSVVGKRVIKIGRRSTSTARLYGVKGHKIPEMQVLAELEKATAEDTPLETPEKRTKTFDAIIEAADTYPERIIRRAIKLRRETEEKLQTDALDGSIFWLQLFLAIKTKNPRLMHQILTSHTENRKRMYYAAIALSKIFKQYQKAAAILKESAYPYTLETLTCRVTAQLYPNFNKAIFYLSAIIKTRPPGIEEETHLQAQQMFVDILLTHREELTYTINEAPLPLHQVLEMRHTPHHQQQTISPLDALVYIAKRLMTNSEYLRSEDDRRNYEEARSSAIEILLEAARDGILTAQLACANILYRSSIEERSVEMFLHTIEFHLQLLLDFIPSLPPEHTSFYLIDQDNYYRILKQAENCLLFLLPPKRRPTLYLEIEEIKELEPEPPASKTDILFKIFNRCRPYAEINSQIICYTLIYFKQSQKSLVFDHWPLTDSILQIFIPFLTLQEHYSNSLCETIENTRSQIPDQLIPMSESDTRKFIDAVMKLLNLPLFTSEHTAQISMKSLAIFATNYHSVIEDSNPIFNVIKKLLPHVNCDEFIFTIVELLDLDVFSNPDSAGTAIIILDKTVRFCRYLECPEEVLIVLENLVTNVNYQKFPTFITKLLDLAYFDDEQYMENKIRIEEAIEQRLADPAGGGGAEAGAAGGMRSISIPILRPR